MALLAAIVVVANTTLVSVVQRAREIGIRRAVGASRGNVRVETLTEAAVVGLMGGGLGLLAAFGALAAASSTIGFQLSPSWATVAASLGAAGLSGIVAGWYPARRAAALDVINALRQE